MAAEKRIIRETSVALSGDSRLTEAMIDSLLKELNVPSLNAFRYAVGRIVKRGEAYAATIQDTARRIVGTQKSVHPSEQEALDYIEQRIAKGLKAASAAAS